VVVQFDLEERSSLKQGNWNEIARLGGEAQDLGLHPNDQVEWMPFLQAYAFLGDEKHVKALSTRINTDPSYRQLACNNINAMNGYGYPLSPDIQQQVDELFCQ
jgi:hypothetical protein